MIKHYVLTLNPEAQYDWEQSNLREPITGVCPDLTAMLAEAVDNQPGSYLISVNVEVKVLEKVATHDYQQLSLNLPKLSSATQLEELMAS
ncbi:MAG: hypothetical protein WA865_05300 [Spirulinaceae cyanobacterium]